MKSVNNIREIGHTHDIETTIQILTYNQQF